MLKYEDVVDAPVTKLKEAADDWSEMLTKLEKLAVEARRGMKAKSDRADWRGLNAGVTKPFITKTAREFDDAEAQARSIKMLLADAHASFKAAKDALLRIRDEESPAAGIHVDANGKVRPRHDLKTDAAARHDPGYAEALRKQEQAVASWQRKIDRIVEDCSDADDSLKRALAANVKGAHNFTAPKYESLDAEQVDRAAELMKKVTGDDGTARNVAALKELEDLLDDNRSDPGFSASFYRKLGAEGTLEAYANMSLNATSLGPSVEAQDRVRMVRNIQNDMGAILGLATQASTPNHLGAMWTTQLMKVGRKELDVSGTTGLGTKLYGYQALAALLREGTYNTEFLTSVGRDMVAMDKKNPGIWDHSMPIERAMSINLDNEGGSGFNPLTGLMEAMSHNPEASTAFFNEPLREDTNKDGIVTLSDGAIGGKDAQGLVDYMLDKKPTADYYDTIVGGEATPGQTALGNALEAAVAGRVPGDEDAPPVYHTEAMSNVMEQVVAKIGADPTLVAANPGDMPGPLSGLAPQFGNMAAEYMPDLQGTAENGANQAKPLGVMAEFRKDEMALFLGAVGQDPQAYGAITNAQQAYTTALVSDVFRNPDEHGDTEAAIQNAVHPGGEIAGILTEARAQAIHDTKAHEADEYNKGVEENAKWTNRVIDALGARYVEMVPVLGDAVMWMKEEVTESAVNSALKDNTEESRRESAEGYTRAEGAAKLAAASAVETAARGSGLTQEQIDEYRGAASTQTATAHSIGRDLVASSAPKGS
ncbi:hypothetical protein [Streptomyces peucetius]|uniref:Uncharacterized protein n=1 Tax=Streptomyces peucetius TaxID=1950 RepID=A0ABY6I5V3_STRPE|nr:hypothetical protein [Streptomyces peucetius]UYQ62371.1 hypothetical protein OGH68_13360 [Streptomyces peucetius]